MREAKDATGDRLRRVWARYLEWYEKNRKYFEREEARIEARRSARRKKLEEKHKGALAEALIPVEGDSQKHFAESARAAVVAALLLGDRNNG